MQTNKPFIYVGAASVLLLAVAGFLFIRELQGASEPELLSRPLVTRGIEKPVAAKETRPTGMGSVSNSSSFVSNAPLVPAPKTEEPQVVAVLPSSQEDTSSPPASAGHDQPHPPSVQDSTQPKRQNAISADSVSAEAVAVPSKGLPPQGGSLGRLTTARAELQELKTLVEIEQERAKLRDLQTPKVVPLSLPPVTAPQVSAPHAPSFPARVVAVSGVGGRMVATVQTVKGTRRLHVGDAFEGGRVESISRDSVNIRTGSRIQTLWFKE